MPSDLLRGTLEMMVLQVLSDGPLHGYAIGRRIQEQSREALSIEQGSLYPALYRLEAAGWIRSRWGRNPESRRKARIYRLTAAGRTRLQDDVRGWNAFVAAVSRVVPSE
ncbi:MAG: PadR family transcriptional regulator [Acidobacteria bacterium]|nr:PadR family transcriptional regulator [Acidobacteriota bacterium]